MKIGIAGTGRMGAAIGERLMAEGHDLVVWNRTTEKTRPLVEAGATEAATPADLARQDYLKDSPAADPRPHPREFAP